MESLLVGNKAPAKNYLRPGFIRPAPPLHPCQDELVWMNPIDTSRLTFEWDANMTQNTNSGGKYLRLLFCCSPLYRS